MSNADTRLGAILLEEGRTQSWLAMQVAARLGRPVYRQEVGRWVNGVHVPQDGTKAAIAEALKRPVADVFPDAHEAASSSATDTPPLLRRNPDIEEQAA